MRRRLLGIQVLKQRCDEHVHKIPRSSNIPTVRFLLRFARSYVPASKIGCMMASCSNLSIQVVLLYIGRPFVRGMCKPLCTTHSADAHNSCFATSRSNFSHETQQQQTTLTM